MSFCVECGAKMHAEAKFCAACGSPKPNSESQSNLSQKDKSLLMKHLNGTTNESEKSSVKKLIQLNPNAGEFIKNLSSRVLNRKPSEKLFDESKSDVLNEQKQIDQRRAKMLSSLVSGEQQDSVDKDEIKDNTIKNSPSLSLVKSAQYDKSIGGVDLTEGIDAVDKNSPKEIDQAESSEEESIKCICNHCWKIKCT